MLMPLDVVLDDSVASELSKGARSAERARFELLCFWEFEYFPSLTSVLSWHLIFPSAATSNFTHFLIVQASGA